MNLSSEKIRRVFSHPYILFLFRFILGSVFIYAGVQKVMSPADFSQAIQNYMILPVFLANMTAIFLPWLEIYCGVFLLAGLLTRASALLISVMILIFILALFSALIRGLDITCGCFGEATPVDWLRISEDLLLLGMSIHIKGASHP
jgi:putative oxidoreductase